LGLRLDGGSQAPPRMKVHSLHLVCSFESVQSFPQTHTCFLRCLPLRVAFGWLLFATFPSLGGVTTLGFFSYYKEGRGRRGGSGTPLPSPPPPHPSLYHTSLGTGFRSKIQHNSERFVHHGGKLSCTPCLMPPCGHSTSLIGPPKIVGCYFGWLLSATFPSLLSVQ